MPASSLLLRAKPLTVDAFRPYGNVIEATPEAAGSIQSGTAFRFDDLANVEVGTDGQICVNILQMTEAVSFPHSPAFLECHPLGSQAFVPIDTAAFIIAVARPCDAPAVDAVRAFVTDGRQGINYKPGVWHLPMSSLAPATFLMIERKGPGVNLRKHQLSDRELIIDV